MDPNHMKFLEEDEVETMHSGADVDAFNRANSQHISDSAHTASQFIPQWQTSATDGIASFQSGQDTEQQATNPQSNDQKTLPAGTGNQQTSICNQDMTALNQQHTGMGMNSQQSTISGTCSLQQPGGASMRNKQVPFGMMLPIILPQLDKDSAMQLQTLYLKLKKNEIRKDDFVRRMRSIVDDQMLKMAVYELQTQAQSTQSMVMSLNNQQYAAVESNEQKTLPTGTGNRKVSIGNQDRAGINQHNTGIGKNSQQSTMSGTGLQQSGGASMRNKPVPFGMLLHVIQPQLDKDRAMQLQTLNLKLKKNEITKYDFGRRMRSIVGDKILKKAVYKLQTQATKQQSVNRFQPQNQPPARQPQVPSTGTNLSLQMPTNLTNSTRDINTINSREMESKADLQGAQGSQMPTSTLNAFNQDRSILAKEGHLELQSILAKIDSFKM